MVQSHLLLAKHGGGVENNQRNPDFICPPMIYTINMARKRPRKGEYFAALATVCMYVCIGIAYSKSMDQPGKVANTARGQLNRRHGYFPVPVCA